LIVAELAPADLDRCLRHAGLRLRTGPVVAEIRSPLASLREGLALHYARHMVVPEGGFADFHVGVAPAPGLRGRAGGRVLFDSDGAKPFAPAPAEQGFALLEAGLDWCLWSHCHQYLMVRAAVLARGDRALLLPAPPGAGKSTLCAGLALGGGWRLLSDSLALVVPASGLVLPLARPIGLKNQSIDVVRTLAPTAEFGAEIRDAKAGRIAFASPPAQSVVDSQRPATPAWVVEPRFEVGAATRLRLQSRARGFMALVDNAFNYDVHGRAGFAAFARVIDRCRCLDLTYGSLPEAIDALDRLASSGP
jgi:HprK-related kinase A